MATLQTRFPTLLDVALRYDPDKKTIYDVAELLAQTNEMIQDIPWIEGNEMTGHTAMVRTSLPASTWRRLYKGVPATKSTAVRVTDAVGLLEQRSEVDKAAAELNGMSAAFMMDEAAAHIEGMSQDFASTLIYGDTSVNPERFTGLAARYNALSGFEGAQNVINAGGSGSDVTSMWLIAWGRPTVHGIYPKGSQAGLQREWIGLGDAFDDATPPARYRAYMERFEWKCGIHVRDWRYVVRIANIEVSDLPGAGLGSATQAATATTNLLRCMVKALHRLPNGGRLGRPVFYANAAVREGLDLLGLEKTSGVLSAVTSGDQFQTSFRGVPIKTMDALLNTETALA
ncbi:MAG: major capsid protein [Rhodospirillales bacterium]